MGAARIWILKQLDATLGRAACRVAGAALYRSHREIHLDAVDPARLRRILVIRPGGMGDMLQLVPTLRRLAAATPAARVDLVCERRNRAVATLAGLNVDILCYDAEPARTVARLLNTRYDVAIDTEQFHHFSAVMAWISGAPVRIGFNINPVRNPAYTHLVNYAADGPEARQFSSLLRPLGIADGTPAAIQGALSGAARPEAPAAVRALPRYAAVHAGGSAAIKQWGLDRFSALCSDLMARQGLTPVVVGDRRDREVWVGSQGRAAAAADGTVVTAGELSLPQTAAVIARSAVFVGGDSGLAHLAVALGVPSVVLFGPSDERKWGVVDGRHAVASHSVPCRPCCVFGYHKPCHAVACLRGITVEQVAEAVSKVVG